LKLLKFHFPFITVYVTQLCGEQNDIFGECCATSVSGGMRKKNTISVLFRVRKYKTFFAKYPFLDLLKQFLQVFLPIVVTPVALEAGLT
jgi:hypothetical protein